MSALSEWPQVRTPPAGWKRIPNHPAFLRGWAEANGEVPAPNMFKRGPVNALVGREPWGGDRWHLSISADGRLPTWDEIVETAHALRPGVPFVMGVPPRSWWMNIQPYTLHLWETHDAPLVDEWRQNSRGDVPS
jgi:hypothetical protein